MKTPILVSGLALAAAMAGSAQAAFTGLTVESMGTIGGRDVYRVYANFNSPTDVFLSCLKHQLTVGSSMSSVLHNDFGGGSGTWNPAATFTPEQALNDSYVNIDGILGFTTDTKLDPDWGSGNGSGSTIPNSAGWYDGNPTTAVVVGATGRVMIMQVAIAVGGAGYSANLQVSFKESGSTTPIFASGSYTIPAPGAIALLGAAGMVIGRRRRS